jgi:hypothetical protein
MIYQPLYPFRNCGMLCAHFPKAKRSNVSYYYGSKDDSHSSF